MSSIKDPQFLSEAIKHALQTRLAEEAQELLVSFEKQLKERMNKIIAETAMYVSEQYTMERFEREIVIKVKIGD
jgi:hypothetical protein